MLHRIKPLFHFGELLCMEILTHHPSVQVRPSSSFPDWNTCKAFRIKAEDLIQLVHELVPIESINTLWKFRFPNKSFFRINVKWLIKKWDWPAVAWFTNIKTTFLSNFPLFFIQKKCEEQKTWNLQISLIMIIQKERHQKIWKTSQIHYLEEESQKNLSSTNRLSFSDWEATRANWFEFWWI